MLFISPDRSFANALLKGAFPVPASAPAFRGRFAFSVYDPFLLVSRLRQRNPLPCTNFFAVFALRCLVAPPPQVEFPGVLGSSCLFEVKEGVLRSCSFVFFDSGGVSPYFLFFFRPFPPVPVFPSSSGVSLVKTKGWDNRPLPPLFFTQGDPHFPQMFSGFF